MSVGARGVLVTVLMLSNVFVPADEVRTGSVAEESLDTIGVS